MPGLASMVFAVLAALCLTLVIAELRGWLSVLTRRLVVVASNRLPAAHRGRYQDEWLAEGENNPDAPQDDGPSTEAVRNSVREGARIFGLDLNPRRPGPR